MDSAALGLVRQGLLAAGTVLGLEEELSAPLAIDGLFGGSFFDRFDLNFRPNTECCSSTLWSFPAKPLL